MTELLLFVALVLSLGLGAWDRRQHAAERARLTAAALHRSPEAAAAVVTDTARPVREREPRPKPIGL